MVSKMFQLVTIGQWVVNKMLGNAKKNNLWEAFTKKNVFHVLVFALLKNELS